MNLRVVLIAALAPAAAFGQAAVPRDMRERAAAVAAFATGLDAAPLLEPVQDPGPGRPVPSSAGDFDRKAALEVVARAGKFLIEGQDRGGFWGIGSGAYSDWDTAWTRAPITAIVIAALERAGIPGAKQAAARGAAYVREHGLKDKTEVKPAGNVNLRPYALVFSLSFAARRKDGSFARACAGAIDAAWEKGFGYGASGGSRSSFQVALLALSLEEAEGRGVPLPKGLRGKVLDALESMRLKHGGFPYQEGSVWEKEPEGAAGSVLCELALYRAKRSDQDRLWKAVERFMTHRAGLAEVFWGNRRGHQGPHSWARYYYISGLAWTARALKEFPARQAAPHAAVVGKAMLEIEAKRSRWVGSPNIEGPHYGAAAAIEALLDVVEIMGAASAAPRSRLRCLE